MRGIDTKLRNLRVAPEKFLNQYVNFDCWIDGFKKGSRPYEGDYILEVKNKEGEYLFRFLIVSKNKNEMVDYLVNKLREDTDYKIRVKAFVKEYTSAFGTEYYGIVKKISFYNLYYNYGSQKKFVKHLE